MLYILERFGLLGESGVARIMEGREGDEVYQWALEKEVVISGEWLRRALDMAEMGLECEPNAPSVLGFDLEAPDEMECEPSEDAEIELSEEMDIEPTEGIQIEVEKDWDIEPMHVDDDPGEDTDVEPMHIDEDFAEGM